MGDLSPVVGPLSLEHVALLLHVFQLHSQHTIFISLTAALIVCLLAFIGLFIEDATRASALVLEVHILF